MKESAGNVYEDAERAASYARLEFPGTYWLAFRDLPEILRAHAPGPRALDFGCGAGRSTRFLKALGYDAAGLDVAAAMVAQARARDPGGDYRVAADGDFAVFEPGAFDLILAAFTFDNVADREHKIRLLRGLGALLAPAGVLVNLVSTPEIYLHEWASFSTRDFPENRAARSGDPVRIVMLDVPDRRPVVDTLCSDEDWNAIHQAAGWRVRERWLPLGRAGDPVAWVSEECVPPWAITVLDRGA